MEVRACLSYISISFYLELTAKLWAILWAEWDERPGFACVCQELGLSREPEAMLWEFEVATVLLPALFLWKDQGNKTRSHCDYLPDVLSGGVWFGESWAGESSLVLRARSLGKPAGLELAENAGSLCGTTAQPADFPVGELCGQTGKKGHILAHSQLCLLLSLVNCTLAGLLLSLVSWTLAGAYSWL